MSISRRHNSLKNALQVASDKGESYLLVEYMENAEFQFWLQRTSKNIILCLLSCLALIFFCESFPEFKTLLYGVFKWVLIPVKPLLLASPPSALSGLLAFITPISQVANLLFIPVIGTLALKAGRLPTYLYIEREDLLVLQKRGARAGSNANRAFVIDGSEYMVKGIFPLASSY